MPTDSTEDARRTEAALRALNDGVGVPADEVEAWVQSWDTDQEIPPPRPRKLF